MIGVKPRLLTDVGLLIVFLALIVGGCAPTGQAPAQGTMLDEIVSRGTLRAGVPVAGLPNATRDASGNIVGFIPDMAAEMAKALGVKLEMVDTSDPNRIPYVQAGKIDFAVGTVTQDRLKVVSFTRPWVIGSLAGLVLKTSDIKSYDALHGKKIALVTGATGDILTTKRFPDNNLMRVDLQSTAVQMVESGQADIAIGDVPTFDIAMTKDANLVMLPTLMSEPAGLMIKRNDTMWQEWLNNFLNDFFVSGTSTCGCGRELYKKYFQQDPDPLLLTLYY